MNTAYITHRYQACIRNDQQSSVAFEITHAANPYSLLHRLGEQLHIAPRIASSEPAIWRNRVGFIAITPTPFYLCRTKGRDRPDQAGRTCCADCTACTVPCGVYGCARLGAARCLCRRSFFTTRPKIRFAFIILFTRVTFCGFMPAIPTAKASVFS